MFMDKSTLLNITSNDWKDELTNKNIRKTTNIVLHPSVSIALE